MLSKLRSTLGPIFVCVFLSMLIGVPSVVCQSSGTLLVKTNSREAIPIDLKANQKVIVHTECEYRMFLYIYLKADYDTGGDPVKSVGNTALQNITLEYGVEVPTSLVIVFPNQSPVKNFSVTYSITIEDYIPLTFYLYSVIGVVAVAIGGIVLYRRKRWERGLSDSL